MKQQRDRKSTPPGKQGKKIDNQQIVSCVKYRQRHSTKRKEEKQQIKKKERTRKTTKLVQRRVVGAPEIQTKNGEDLRPANDGHGLNCAPPSGRGREKLKTLKSPGGEKPGDDRSTPWSALGNEGSRRA